MLPYSYRDTDFLNCLQQMVGKENFLTAKENMGTEILIEKMRKIKNQD